jgi:hypothetical protein
VVADSSGRDAGHTMAPPCAGSAIIPQRNINRHKRITAAYLPISERGK